LTGKPCALETGAKLDFAALSASHASLFSLAELHISPAVLQAMAELIIAIESVVALPAYQQRVLLAAPPDRPQKPLAARSVFFGYDFHLDR
jgi:hypothetical protein